MKNTTAIIKVIAANGLARGMSFQTKDDNGQTLVKWFDGNQSKWLISRVNFIGGVKTLHIGGQNYINKLYDNVE